MVVLGLVMAPGKADRQEEVERSIYKAATCARRHLVVIGDPDVAAAYGFETLAADLRGAYW